MLLDIADGSMNRLFLKVPRSGGEPGIFLIFRLFSLTSSALDHSATAPPSKKYEQTLNGSKRTKTFHLDFSETRPQWVSDSATIYLPHTQAHNSYRL